MTELSLVVPIYNLGEYLPPMLATLANQTRGFELWLVDDGSTDASAEVAARFVRGMPDWHAVARPHGGIAAARNWGLAHATKDAVAFVDGDDRLAPDFVARLAAGFAADVPAVTVGYRWWHNGGARQPHWQHLSQAAMFAQVAQHGSPVGGYVWNKAFRRAAIGGLRFDERLRIAEDYWFTASFVAANPGVYAFWPAVGYTKIARSGSAIHVADRSQEAQVFARIRRLEEGLQHGDGDNRHQQ